MRNLKSILFTIALAFAATSLVGLGMTGCEEKKEEKKDDEKKEGEGEGESAEGEGAEGEGAEGEGAEGEGEEGEGEGEGETAEGEGEGEGEGAEGETAEGGGEGEGMWGEKCTAYFTEVEKLCADIGDDSPHKATCDQWVKSIETMKSSVQVPEGAAEEQVKAAYAAAEQGCEQAAKAVKQAGAAMKAQ